MKKLIVLAASRVFPGRSPMKTTRRFALATLLVVAVAVVLGAPAPASAGQRSSYLTYVKLYPTADSPSRNATGTVTLLDPLGFAIAIVVIAIAKYSSPTTISHHGNSRLAE